MPHPPTSTRSPGVGARVLGLAALFIASAAGVSFWCVGRLSESIDPEDADYLWRPWPLLENHQNVLGAVSVITFVAAGAALGRARREGQMPAPLVAQVAISTLFAAWLGLAYRIVTAASTGANIGGGAALLVTPVLALISVASVAGLALRSSRRAKPMS